MEIIYGYQNPERTEIEVMTEQQALQDDYYHKIFKEQNGLIKKIETYKDQNLWAIQYYLDRKEDEFKIIKSLYDLVDNVSVFTRKIPLGKYFVEKERVYEKSLPSTIWRNLRIYDSQDRMVCYTSIDENENSYIGTVEKYCYVDITTIETDGTSSTDLFYLQFEYNDSDNEINGIDLNKGHIVQENRGLIDTLKDINEVREFFQNDDDFNYYLHPNWRPY